MESVHQAELEGRTGSEALMKAIKTLPDSGEKMMEAWIESQVSTLGEGLTQPQQAYLAALMAQSLKGKLWEGRYGESAGPLMEARDALRNEDSEAAPWIIGLLERVGLSDRPQDLNILKRYNQTARKPRMDDAAQ